MSSLRFFGGKNDESLLMWLIIITVTFSVIISSCAKKPEPFSIVEIKGDGEIMNFSRDFLTVSFYTDSVRSNYLLAGKGDLLAFGDNCFTLFSANEKNILTLDQSNKPYHLNGKLKVLPITDHNDMVSMLMESDSIALSHLEFISFKSELQKDHVPYLLKLAENNPGVGLSFATEINISRLLKIFDPGVILGITSTVENMKIISAEPNLETLWLTLKDSINSASYPQMADLEQLFIEGGSKESVIGDQLLKNNPQLEKLAVMQLGTFDCSVLKPLTSLRELMIFDCDTVINADLIRGLKKLEVLIPKYEDFIYDITEKDLPALRWISFNSNVPQEVFDSFISSNPNLEVVEISKNKEITSLGSLLRLKKLFGLTITDTLTDINGVKSLKNLKYLSLPIELMEDSQTVSMISQALPGTVLSSNQGLCLGSGWLLLLIPFVLLFRFSSMKKRSETGLS